MSARKDSGRIGVIGGGLGGLAAACTLAARGHKVVLFDANAWAGGKAAVLEEGGFRFDMGQTILTVPRVLRRIFAEAGRDMDRELDLVRLDPVARGEDLGSIVLRDHPDVAHRLGGEHFDVPPDAEAVFGRPDGGHGGA